MDRAEDVVEKAIAALPEAAQDFREWCRAVVQAIVPVALQASVTHEEGALAQFSLVVLHDWKAQIAWPSLMLTDFLDVNAGIFAKLSGLTKPGHSHLIAFQTEHGDLKIMGLGKPPVEFAFRDGLFDPDGVTHPFKRLIAVTVLGPCTVLVEGFGAELAFLFEGKLQEPLDSDLSRKVSFFKGAAAASRVEIPDWAGAEDANSKQEFRMVMAEAVVQKLVRGAWFGRRGGLFGFALRGDLFSNWGASAARWIQVYPEVLNLLPLLVERYSAVLAMTADRGTSAYNRVRRAEENFSEAISTTVRMSKLDGAVLLNEDLRVVAFGAKLTARKPKCLLVRRADGTSELDLSQKGTRHLSAYSWVCARKDRMAVVISQDRKVKLFGRAHNEDVVYWDVRAPLFE